MKAIADWLKRYNEREQAYLLAAAAALILYALFMGVWKPLSGMRDDMARRNAATEESLARVQAMASELKQLRATASGPRTTNMNQLINASTAEVGIRPSRIQPNSRGEPQIRFENVGFAELLRWMHRIEFREGIAIKEVAINPGDRGGLVKATIRLGQGA